MSVACSNLSKMNILYRDGKFVSNLTKWGEIMAFTGGPILNPNNEGVTLTVLISNDDTAVTATVEVELFEVTISTTGVAKTPVAHQLFTVPPLDVATHSFGILGFPAYETQFNVTSTTDVVIDEFTIDAMGKLVAAQRVLQAEKTTITAITPVP